MFITLLQSHLGCLFFYVIIFYIVFLEFFCREEQKRDEERAKEEQRAKEAKEQSQQEPAGVTQTDGPQQAPTARYGIAGLARNELPLHCP